jgi:hypothetical protein
MVLLSDDSRLSPPMAIRDIRVLQTVKAVKNRVLRHGPTGRPAPLCPRPPP